MGYMASDPDGALPIPEAGVQAVEAEIREKAASERAADAWAEAAAEGNGTSARATASRLTGRGAMGITFGTAAAAVGGLSWRTATTLPLIARPPTGTHVWGQSSETRRRRKRPGRRRRRTGWRYIA